MSSILKALKKAEEARSGAAGTRQSETRFYSDASDRQKTNPLIIIACIAIIAVAASYSVYVRSKTGTAGRTDTANTARSKADTQQSANNTPKEQDKAASLQTSEASGMIKQGRYAEAEILLKKAAELHPEDAELHNNLGIALRMQNRLKEAEAAYGAALKIKPDYPEALNNLAVIIGMNGDRNRAAELYRKAIALKPSYAEAHLNLAMLLESGGSRKEAKMHFLRFLELSSDQQLNRQVRQHMSGNER